MKGLLSATDYWNEHADRYGLDRPAEAAERDIDHGHEVPPACEIPECLSGIYDLRTAWIPYDLKQGYDKHPCMIRLDTGEEHGPCFPNAGKFCSLTSSEVWWEDRVAAISYFRAAA